ncbi:MAG TPA: uroporphyrinogen decarboxylase family protein [Anaerolineae bacterium]|nr:uroporphyrinogen decarboxylase family protein [Anaerolineae bacterium]HQJ51675.1 uroporphyrinogen decarboxylase family protein [Anaerolineae bacterium]
MTKTKLTHRERVRRALEHQEADRVPIDLGGVPIFTTLHIDAETKLKAHLGYAGGSPVLTSINSQSVRPDPRIMRRWDVDCYPLWVRSPNAWKLELHTEPDGSSWFVDEWGVRQAKPAGGFYYDPAGNPLRGGSLADLERTRFPNPRDPGRIAGLADEAKHLHEDTDYCVVMNPVGATGVVAQGAFLCSFEDWFMKIAADKPFVRALISILEDFHLQQWDMILDAAGRYIDVALMSDDIGFQTGPQFRPALYRELFKPTHARIASFIKSKAPHVKVLYHSCGDVWQYLNDFAENGFDAWNPVQVSCPSFQDTARLKATFGDKITFWGGGVDTQKVLPFGTPDEVRAEVIHRMNDFKPGGGFVFAAVQNIQRDVPPENVVACFDCAVEHSWYS